MSQEYTGKIRKVLNGLTAFAEVTIRLDDAHEGLGGVSLSCGTIPEFRSAAVMGVCFALRQMEIDYVHFTILDVKSVLVDTSPAHVMIAAARAVWSWGDLNWQSRYKEDDDYLLDIVRSSHEDPKANFRSIPMLHQ